MSEPLVSVIVPCYNAQRWLDETFDCLERQQYARLEILAVDDGSTDSTWEKLQRRADPRLKRFRQRNRGAAEARNFGLARATGDFVQFLDADDLMAPDKIALQVREAERRGPGWVIAAAWGRFVGSIAQTVWEAPWRPLEQRGIDWLVRSWASGAMMPPHGWLVPRAIVDSVGPWEARAGINDDGEYFTRVLLAASGACQVVAARVHYRSGNASYSQRTDRWAWQSLLDSYELSALHMLSFENSPRVRSAVASRLQSFQYLAYPRFADLVARADSIASRLGLPHGIPHGGGRASRIAGRLIGWKLTRRLGALVRD